MTVKDILDRVSVLYNDVDFVRVPLSTYMQFLDDAINALILARPDAHVKNAVVKLQTGSRQDLPTDGYSLIDIYLNRGQTGATAGAPIFQVDRKDLDYFSSWHVYDPNVTEISEFAYDSRSPKTFWVSPPAGNVDIYVEMDYSFGVEPYANRPETTEQILAMEIPLSDIFRNPLVCYMLYLLYSTDSASDNDRTVAQRYEQSFYQSLGLEYKASIIVMPRVESVEVNAVGQGAVNG